MSESKSAPRKPKLVRDSFTIPKTEYAAIDQLKTRAIALGTSVKKSELLRAGLMALVGMNDAAFKAAVAAVPTLKPGRPQAEPASTPAPQPAPARKAAAKKAPPKKAVATKPAVRKPAVKAAPASAPPESPSGAPRRARGAAATTRRPS